MGHRAETQLSSGRFQISRADSQALCPGDQRRQLGANLLPRPLVGQIARLVELLRGVNVLRLSRAQSLSASAYALAASARSACWAVQTSRHARQQSNTDQQISFRNR